MIKLEKLAINLNLKKLVKGKSLNDILLKGYIFLLNLIYFSCIIKRGFVKS